MKIKRNLDASHFFFVFLVSLWDSFSIFRAGHAHAGVLVILAIIAQFLIDSSNASRSVEMFLRLGFSIAPILISGGFFASAIGTNIVKPNSPIKMLYIGVSLLAVVLIFPGIELIRNR
jgi:hypothetical protein